MPLIFPSNTLSAGGFSVDNSCRFNDDDSAYMYRSNGTPTSQRKLTISTWLKRGTDMATTDYYMYFMGIQDTGVGDPRLTLGFTDSGQILAGENGSPSEVWKMKTNAVYKDPGAWYHIVLSIDTTQATEANRLKIYVNGTQVTSFATSNYPTQDLDMDTTGDEINIACIDNTSPSGFLDGYMAEMVYCDGQAYAASDFGEFDEDSPTIWKPIDVSGLTFGDNGFYLDFEDSANLGNDANGGTDFTTSGLAATDQSSDSPSNNFCTMNPLDNYFFGATFSEGNLKVVSTDSIETFGTGTMGVASGKWYWEVKVTAASGYTTIGIASEVSDSASNYLGEKASTPNYMYDSGTGDSYTDGTGTSYGNTYTTGDIISVALNLDDNEIKYYKNGTVQNSGTAVSITAAASTPIGFYLPAGGDRHNDSTTLEFNFGSPAYAITSGNTDADGYGNFEYAVPSGYYALCTKNIGAYGG